MRAKRIGPHRTNLIVRCTKCKNFCAADHANVSDIASATLTGTPAKPSSSPSICRFFAGEAARSLDGRRRRASTTATPCASSRCARRRRPCRTLSSAGSGSSALASALDSSRLWSGSSSSSPASTSQFAGPSLRPRVDKFPDRRLNRCSAVMGRRDGEGDDARPSPTGANPPRE
jgi:hypothetical protein